MKIDINAKPNSTLNTKTHGWRTEKPDYIHEKCISCGVCYRVCPEGTVYNTCKKNSSGKEYYDFDADYCKGCGICAAECPVKAIVMESDNDK